MATPFGKALRMYRIQKNLLLKDMASDLGMNPAYLSAIETGKRRITESILGDISGYIARLGFGETEVEKLRGLVESSQPSVSINLLGRDDPTRALVASFARQLSDLSTEDKQRLEDILSEKR